MKKYLCNIKRHHFKRAVMYTIGLLISLLYIGVVWDIYVVSPDSYPTADNVIFRIICIVMYFKSFGMVKHSFMFMRYHIYEYVKIANMCKDI